MGIHYNYIFNLLVYNSFNTNVKAVSKNPMSRLFTLVACKCIHVVGCRGSALEYTFRKLKPGRTYNIKITVWTHTTKGSEAVINLQTSK